MKNGKGGPRLRATELGAMQAGNECRLELGARCISGGLCSLYEIRASMGYNKVGGIDSARHIRSPLSSLFRSAFPFSLSSPSSPSEEPGTIGDSADWPSSSSGRARSVPAAPPRHPYPLSCGSRNCPRWRALSALTWGSCSSRRTGVLPRVRGRGHCHFGRAACCVPCCSTRAAFPGPVPDPEKTMWGEVGTTRPCPFPRDGPRRVSPP